MASFLMAQKRYSVYGVDIAPGAIEWANQRFAAAGLVGCFRQGDVCRMPFFENGCFDIVIDGACLHCLIGGDRTTCLDETRRVLQQDGVFIVSSMCGEPKSEAAKSRFDRQLGCLTEDGQPCKTLKPIEDLARELEDSGFLVTGTALRVNPWWDHATITCRAAGPS